jgi:hypothetical protein
MNTDTKRNVQAKAIDRLRVTAQLVSQARHQASLRPTACPVPAGPVPAS